MNGERYRSDIDGLRAVAVISVLLFHLEVSPFKGGFVGVDVFFVISGFLISRLIRDECLEQGSFSFSRFYSRRARRILPALFFTLASCFACAFLLFAPQHFERFGGAMLAAATSLGNVYFWAESGYFDASAEFKPLLHTWSLGVEEQFYLLWPLFLVVITRKSRSWTTVGWVTAIGVLSFLLNLEFSGWRAEESDPIAASFFDLFQDGPATIFYWTPFRIFEFAIGALVIWLIPLQPRNTVWSMLSTWLGLLMVLLPTVLFSEELVFPSYYALVPCLGAALLIHAGAAEPRGHPLRNRLCVGIGQISYSLYLVHWPAIVFYRYVKLDELAFLDKLAITAFSLFAATLMYRFIEQPFRRGAWITAWSPRAVGLLFSVLALMLSIPAASVWMNHGWKWRYPEERIDQLAIDNEHFHAYVWTRHVTLEHDFEDDGRKKVVVIGDSMAADFVNVLVEGGIADELDLVTLVLRHPCAALLGADDDYYRDHPSKEEDRCREKAAEIESSRILEEADTVVLASLWRPEDVAHLSDTVEVLESKGVRQVAILGTRVLPIDGVKLLADFSLRRTGYRLRTPLLDSSSELNARIANVDADFVFIDLSRQYCDDVGCQRFTADGMLLIYDTMHLSPHGARFVGEKAAGADWAIRLTQEPTPTP